LHPRRSFRRRGAAGREIALTELVITDSIAQHEATAGTTRSASSPSRPLLAEAIRRIADESSVSSLFD
jgi:ribose-phosphate pyrophosphokinase